MVDSYPTSGVVLVRGEGDEREVLWTRRPEERSFLGGFRSFFVGGAETGDAEIPVSFRRPPNHPAATMWGTAARELFEETGLLALESGWVAAWEESPAVEPPMASWQRVRERASEEPESFARVLRGGGLSVDGAKLQPHGAWPTPRWAPLQTTTEFFSATLPRDVGAALPANTSSEHRDAEWLAPGRALERWRAGDALVTTPIRLLIDWLDTDLAGAGAPFPDETRRSRVSLDTIEVFEGVRLAPVEVPTLPPFAPTNCWVVGDQRLVVVDPGSTLEHEMALVEALLAGLRAGGARLEAIVLTHHHDDHVGGAEKLRESFGAPIVGHRATADRLDGLVDETVAEGDRLLAGSRHELEVLETPGHAPGHISLSHRQFEALFAGDLVAGEGTVVIDPTEGAMGAYLESLERISALAPAVMFPAHGPPITRPAEHLRRLVEHRHWREKRVEEALEAAAEWSRPADLVPEVYDETPIGRWPVAARSLEAHLDHLVERDVARERGGEYRIF